MFFEIQVRKFLSAQVFSFPGSPTTLNFNKLLYNHFLSNLRALYLCLTL
jgi:hypothetical protein